MSRDGDSGERTRQASVADLAAGEIDRLESSLERASITRILRLQTVLDEQLRERYQTLAVLFSDIAGSTAYFETHGDLAGRKMVQRHNDLLMPIIEGQQGRIIKTIGDAIMATFPSADLAVTAAIGMQEAVAQIRAHARRVEDELSIRLGINFGQALVNDRDGDVYGDMVNVAARVQSQAGPDQIFVSEPVRKALPERIRLRPAGTFTLKGKTDAQPLYEVRWVGTGKRPVPNLSGVGAAVTTDEAEAAASEGTATAVVQTRPLESPIFLLGLAGIVSVALAAGVGAYFALRTPAETPGAGSVGIESPVVAAEPDEAPVVAAPDPEEAEGPEDPVDDPADPPDPVDAIDPLDLAAIPLEPLAPEGAREPTARRALRSRKPATLKVIVTGGWGQILVNGAFRGTSPIAPLELPPGRHLVVVRNPMSKPFRKVLKLRAGEMRTMKVTLEPR